MSEDLSAKKSPMLATTLAVAGGVEGYFLPNQVKKVGDFVSRPAKYDNWEALIAEQKDTFDNSIKEIEDQELAENAKTARQKVADGEAQWDKEYEAFKANDKNKYEYKADAEKMAEAETNLKAAENALNTKREKLVKEEADNLRKNNGVQTRTIKPTVKDFGDPDKITQEMLDKATEAREKAFKTKMEEFADRRFAIMEKSKAGGAAKKAADAEIKVLDKEIDEYIAKEVKAWGKGTPSTFANNARVAIEYYNGLQDDCSIINNLPKQEALLKEHQSLLNKLKASGYADAVEIIEKEGVVDLSTSSTLSKAMRQGQADFVNIQKMYDRFKNVSVEGNKPLATLRIANGEPILELVLEGKTDSAEQVQQFLKELKPEERVRIAKILKRNGITEITAENLEKVASKLYVKDGSDAVNGLKECHRKIGELVEHDLPGQGQSAKVVDGKIIKKNGYEFFARPDYPDGKPQFEMAEKVPAVKKNDYIKNWIEQNTRTENVGKKLTEEEIIANAKKVAEGKLGNEKAEVEKAKEAIEKLKKSGTKVERTEEALKAIFEKQNGAKSEISNKVKGELENGVKKLFEKGGKSGWKQAMVITGASAVSALIGLMLTPRKEPQA